MRAAQRARGAKGSNQYQSRARVFDESAIRRRRDLEAAAWAFTDPDMIPFPAQPTEDDCIRFSVHPSPQVREAVAGCPACPEPVLKALVDGNDLAVRLAAARNPMLGTASVEEVAADAVRRKDADLATAVLRNPSLDPDTVRRMLGPVADWESWRATGRRDQFIAAALAHPRCPAEHVKAFSAFLQHRSAAASHPACPPETLESLLGDAVHKINNPGAFFDLGSRLLGTKIADNPRLPEQAWPAAAAAFPRSMSAHRYASSSWITVEGQRTHATGPLTVRGALAENPHTDPDVIDTLIVQRGRPVGLLVKAIRNPATPTRTLTRLAGHGNTKVERAALAALAGRGVTVPEVVPHPQREHLPFDPPRTRS